jgi:hypothetical protein
MSSPLGGFYLSAINRRTRAKFKLASQLYVSLSAELQINCSSEINLQEDVCIGSNSCFENAFVKLEFTTEVLSTGLLQVACSIYKKLPHDQLKCIGMQELNLSPNEVVTTVVQGNTNIVLIVSASPI